MRILLFLLFVSGPLQAEPVSGSSRLEIGPGGVSFSSGGPANGVTVQDGVATFKFSVSETANPRQAPSPQIVPTTPVGAGVSSFTDSTTFFNSVGQPQ